ncbi:MAG: hypothetical protein LBS03_07345 [Bacteroidales bacterium]|jgi:hypothetical protein|nr:hypothetical protein [Bacteroidales bacterium]
MEESIKRFFFTSLGVFLLMVAGSSILFSQLWTDFPGRITGIAIIWITTTVFHGRLLKVAGKNPGMFSRVFMVQTGIKLLFYSTCMIVYLLFFKTFALRFAILFMAAYLVFSVFEVVSILSFIKKHPK